MTQPVDIEERFRRPLYSVAKCVKMSEIPLLIMQSGDHGAFADRLSGMLGGTVIYASQPDFVEQALASMVKFDYLFVIIDQPLTNRAYGLVHAYLSARDIMGADTSELAESFGAEAPHPQHRLVLIVDRAVLACHNVVSQRSLQELCTVVAAS